MFYEMNIQFAYEIFMKISVSPNLILKAGTEDHLELDLG